VSAIIARPRIVEVLHQPLHGGVVPRGTCDNQIAAEAHIDASVTTITCLAVAGSARIHCEVVCQMADFMVSVHTSAAAYHTSRHSSYTTTNSTCSPMSSSCKHTNLRVVR
jgi:hypothetical protein